MQVVLPGQRNAFLTASGPATFVNPTRSDCTRQIYTSNTATSLDGDVELGCGSGKKWMIIGYAMTHV